MYRTSPYNPIIDPILNQERTAVQHNYTAARDATTTNIIPHDMNQRLLNNNTTGHPMDSANRQRFASSDFTYPPLQHNNMQPFFKGNHVQSNRVDAFTNKLGRFTGNDEFYRPVKTELPTFTDIKPDMSYTHGSPSMTLNADYLSRFIPSTKLHGQRPVEPIRVGRGFGNGYSALPSGGYNQANLIRDYVQPKTIDELRIPSKARPNIPGRTEMGLKGHKRAHKPVIIKRRPERFYKSSPERGNVSSAVKAERIRNRIIIKPTNKQFSRSYTGTAGTSDKLKQPLDPLIKKSTRNTYKSIPQLNPRRPDGWKLNPDDASAALVNDYGRHGITNKPNERQRTGQRTVLHNLTMAVKKIIAPMIDVLKPTRKENTIGNSRPDGVMTAAMPPKLTVHDPNDTPRTTLKEQLIDNIHSGHLSGEDKSYIPMQDAVRTTIKELHVENSSPYLNMNPQQPRCSRVYDPEDIAKTTRKELNIDNEHSGHIGHQDTFAGAYISTHIDVQQTNRQFVSDIMHIGVADGRTTGMGYTTNLIAPPDTTNKEITSNREYTGIAKSNVNAATDYTNVIATTQYNPNKEVLEVGREPTTSNVSLTTGVDAAAYNTKTVMSDSINRHAPMETRIHQLPPSYNMAQSYSTTKSKNLLDHDIIIKRLNPSLLDAFHSNPYTHSLTSSI